MKNDINDGIPGKRGGEEAGAPDHAPTLPFPPNRHWIRHKNILVMPPSLQTAIRYVIRTNPKPSASQLKESTILVSLLYFVHISYKRRKIVFTPDFLPLCSHNFGLFGICWSVDGEEDWRQQ